MCTNWTCDASTAVCETAQNISMELKLYAYMRNAACLDTFGVSHDHPDSAISTQPQKSNSKQQRVTIHHRKLWILAR